jgi:hypothetical protein
MKALILFTLVALLPVTAARAEDSSAPAGTTSSAPAHKKAKKKKAKARAKKKAIEAESPDAVPATSTPQGPNKVSETPPSLKAAETADKKEDVAKDSAASGASDETTNARMKAVEGSKSPYSGQFNITYSGSSVNHPFSKEAPNPGQLPVPPLVSISGTVSARYRLDKKTTMGVGTGVLNQGFKTTSVSDPYADIAHSFRWGPIQNRADFQFTLWTQDQLHKGYGQNLGFSAVDEAFYEWDFGLTTGLAFEIDVNTFSSDAKYDLVKAGQVSYDIYPEPYFEFKLSNRVNLRSVLQVGFEHTRDLGSMKFTGDRVGQTLGVGISATDWLFLYPYVKGVPYSGTFGVKTTVVGLNAIINLF